MKSLRPILGPALYFTAGLCCGGLLVAYFAISVRAAQASLDLNRQFHREQLCFRKLSSNEVDHARAALISQMSGQICGMAGCLESRGLLPFAKRKIRMDLQDARDSLDLWGPDLGTYQPSTNVEGLDARRANAALLKLTVNRFRRVTEAGGAANQNQPVGTETNRTSAAADSGG